MVKVLKPNFNEKTTDNKPFKEDPHHTFLMTSPEKHYDEINKNPYNITHITHMLEKDIVFNDRCNFSIHSSKGVWRDFSDFCKTIRKPLCEVHDKLLLYGMMIIPNKQILLDMEFKVNEKKPVQLEIHDGIICNKLKVWGDRVFEINQREPCGVSNGAYVRFLEIIEEASKFVNPSDRLIKLMEQYKVLI